MQLPPEIIAEDILTRLPVKSLVRFRCVSKSWCSLIASPRFIKSHLAKSIETKSHRKLILHNSTLCCSTDLDSPDVLVEIDHPLKRYDFQTTVMGSCNGLLFICNVNVASLPSSLPEELPAFSPFYKNLYHLDQDSIICNPSTGKHQRLLSAPTEHPFNCCRPQCIVYGFGYDSGSDDYKVVKMMEFDGGTDRPDCFKSVVKIYSLKLNNWKNIVRCPFQVAYDNVYGEFVCGALHWVMKAVKSNGEALCFVVALDLATEKFRVVPLPDFSHMNFLMYVGVLGGSLSLFCHYPSSARMDVWTMQDYGVKESWVNAFSFCHPEVIDDYKYVHPLAFSKSGREVLLVHENKKLSWYDPQGKVSKDIDLQGATGFFNSLVCVPSLVQLPHEAKLGEEKIVHKKKGEGKKGEEKQGEKEKMIAKKRDNYLSKGFKIKL